MIHDLTTIFNQSIALVTKYRIIMLFFACVGLGAGGAFLIAEIPFRKYLLDKPNERSSHRVPTPKGGGVGILAAFILAGLTLRIPTTFIFAVILISAVSFYGDYFRLSVKFRLVVQLFSALMLLFPILPRLSAHYNLSTFGAFPLIFFLILPLILLFLIGTANFYNFMDGIDGIAGLSGAISFGLLGVYTLYRPSPATFQPAMSLLAICIALACLGYLPFNMLRAKVFMGDVGSILLGFVFAALIIELSRNYHEIICFASLLFPFYADELTTMAIRLHDHEDLSQSHRRHLYQILANEAGVAHWKVILMYAAAQLTIGVSVLFANKRGVLPVVLLLIVCFLAFSILSFYVRKKIILKQHLSD